MASASAISCNDCDTAKFTDRSITLAPPSSMTSPVEDSSSTNHDENTVVTPSHHIVPLYRTIQCHSSDTIQCHSNDTIFSRISDFPCTVYGPVSGCRLRDMDGAKVPIIDVPSCEFHYRTPFSRHLICITRSIFGIVGRSIPYGRW